MDLRAAIVEKWPYKAAAVTLSLLLWFNVAADQQRQDQPVRTRLDITVTDTAWSLREAPREVTTMFQGRRGDLIALFNEPAVRKVISDVTGPEMDVELTPADVAYDRGLNVRPTEVRPSLVRIRFETRVSRRVPLVPDTRVELADGFVMGDVVAELDSVTVRGPQSLVQSIGRLRTQPIAPEGRIRRPLTRQVGVALPSELEGIEVDPPQVIVTVEVDSIAERAFRVPVEVEGANADDVTILPPRVRVTVRGGSRAIQSLEETDVRAVARIDAPVTDERSVPVAIQLPPGLTATASADPARVTLSRGSAP